MASFCLSFRRSLTLGKVAQVDMLLRTMSNHIFGGMGLITFGSISVLITMFSCFLGGWERKLFFYFCAWKKKVCLCSRRWSEDNWCCLVAAVVVLIVVAVVGIASWHDAAAVFFGCVRQDVTHDTFIGTSWLWNYRQMWLSGYSALTLETSAPGLPGYYVILNKL